MISKKLNSAEIIVLIGLIFLLFAPLPFGMNAWIIHLSIILPILIPIVLLIWQRRFGVLFCLIYLLVYAVLSANGKYTDLSCAGCSGKIWYPLGFENTVPDHPEGRIKTDSPNKFGRFFWPFLFIDQSYVHKTLNH